LVGAVPEMTWAGCRADQGEPSQVLRYRVTGKEPWNPCHTTIAIGGEGTVATLNHLQRLNSYGVGYRFYTEQYLDSTVIFGTSVWRGPR
jgi:hypothetical protein